MSMKYIDKIEKMIKEAFNYLKNKKKAFYKDEKPSKSINAIRIIFGILLIIISLYAGAKVIVYGGILVVMGVVLYFLIPPGFLEEKGIKLPKSLLIEDKKNKKKK